MRRGGRGARKHVLSTRFSPGRKARSTATEGLPVADRLLRQAVLTRLPTKAQSALYDACLLGGSKVGLTARAKIVSSCFTVPRVETVFNKSVGTPLSLWTFAGELTSACVSYGYPV